MSKPLRRSVLLLALVAVVTGRGLLSGTQVRVDGSRVIVQATSVPLTDVLSRFSQATGTKIVYDAAKPRQLVTVEIDASSQAEALSQLLEGQGLSYALRLDPSGRTVDMLFLSKGQGASSSASTTPAAGRREVERRETYDAIEEPPAEVDAGVQEPQEPIEPAPDPPVDPAAAAPSNAPPVPPGGAPAGAAPAGAVPAGAAPSTPYSPPWQPSPPSFPQAASYPSWR